MCAAVITVVVGNPVSVTTKSIVALVTLPEASVVTWSVITALPLPVVSVVGCGTSFEGNSASVNTACEVSGLTDGLFELLVLQLAAPASSKAAAIQFNGVFNMGPPAGGFLFDQK